MIKTSIPKLDDFFGGSIPYGKSLAYYIQPGVEGDVFGMQTLYNTIKNGKMGIFVVSSSNPKNLYREFIEFGWDIELFKDNFIVVDSYTTLVGGFSDEKYVVLRPDNIEDISKTIKGLLEVYPQSAVVFSSLSTIMDLCGEKETIKAVREWNELAKLYDNVIVYNFTAWPYSNETLDLLKNELFNAVVSIGGIEERVIFGQYFGIIKADWINGNKKSMLFKVARPGGIKIFIPKILVTGPFDSGKTTFVHALSTKSISVDRLGTTIALDHGHIDYKGFSADIFGTPGQDRFDPIIKMLSGESMGVFLIVDSTNPSDFIRAKKMLESTISSGLPYVVVANKQDMPGALKPEDIRKRCAIPEDVPIIPVIASKKIGVFEAFELLIDKITGGI